MDALIGEVQRFDRESGRWLTVAVLWRVVDKTRPHGQFAITDKRRVK